MTFNKQQPTSSSTLCHLAIRDKQAMANAKEEKKKKKLVLTSIDRIFQKSK